MSEWTASRSIRPDRTVSEMSRTIFSNNAFPHSRILAKCVIDWRLDAIAQKNERPGSLTSITSFVIIVSASQEHRRLSFAEGELRRVRRVDKAIFLFFLPFLVDNTQTSMDWRLQCTGTVRQQTAGGSSWMSEWMNEYEWIFYSSTQIQYGKNCQIHRYNAAKIQ